MRSGVHPLDEEGDDPVERGAGRVAGFVDEVDGQHRVRPGWDAERVAWRGVDLDALEGIAERASQGLEPLGGRYLVVGEAQPERAQPVPGPILDPVEVVGVESECRAFTGGQRGG